ncbi:uncharacterized protein B4U79_05620 [Dinothrombium tinctorium]|uniref:HTH CENPB-type domain-containing protein n=1 Tax=Dinothrombium tinctorium TaxID=1965070 RepID=A0A443QBM5_9ACAR|nr:uncharacterized protein B4U79_05620 [Dinothrombium tinctorium]
MDSFAIDFQDTETLDFVDSEVVDDDLSVNLYDDEFQLYQIEGTRDSFTLEYMKDVLAFVDSGTYSFNTIQHRFRRVRHQRYISRFREYVNQQGTTSVKCKEVTNYTMQKFKNARENLLPVHDIDLRRWAMDKAREIQFINFNASRAWVLNLKNENKIVSRKITHVVTRHNERDQQAIMSSATNFLNEINGKIANYNKDYIFNTDQSGFKYTFYSTRTLSNAGESNTSVLVDSTNATTHSFTIQVMISLSGKVMEPFYICLQESGGTFGPRVSQNLFNPGNCVINCSNSGKMTKQLVRHWGEQCLKPVCEENSLLLLDSWTGQSDNNLFNFDNVVVEIGRIPPKTTPLIQPLDVYFFRQWKIFVRKIYDRVALDKLDYDLKNRNSVIRIHCLIHNQLKAPVFQKMIQYAWFKSGYISDFEGPFQNVNEVCFDVIAESCVIDLSQCTKGVFIRCAYCRNTLCFKHFYNGRCFH